MHYKQNNKESKTYVQGLRPFGNTLPRGVKGILKKNGYNYSEIISKWNILVGKDISSYAYPISIKMKKGDTNGILVLGIKRGDEINVEYSKKEIIEKINSYFGYKVVEKLKLVSFDDAQTKFKNPVLKKNDVTNSKYEEKLIDIKNDKIKKSLLELSKLFSKK